ncbi:MAG: PLD nuclease N-terminal domain-containing protein [Actinomycetota bacterium]|nr:PLD nuclease N-terminal domain-containing protein [Actinomycetota bacterium]
MLRVAGIIVLLAVYIWFIVDVISSPKSSVRNLPKGIWFIIVVFVPLIGGAIWVLFGRTKPIGGGRRKRRNPSAPDDDPRFLAKLEEDAWKRRMRERRGES